MEETLTTALSTLSLDLIGSDNFSASGTAHKARRGSSSSLVRTYSNCSYTVVNTFRHTPECRATTLPATLRARQLTHAKHSYPTSCTALPTLSLQAPVPPLALRKITSSAHRNDSHPIGVRLGEQLKRSDNKAYELCSPETEQLHSHTETLRAADQSDPLRGNQHQLHSLTQTGIYTHGALLQASRLRSQHPLSCHDKEKCIVWQRPLPVRIEGSCSHPIRLHPPVGHKIASYV